MIQDRFAAIRRTVALLAGLLLLAASLLEMAVAQRWFSDLVVVQLLPHAEGWWAQSATVHLAAALGLGLLLAAVLTWTWPAVATSDRERITLLPVGWRSWALFAVFALLLVWLFAVQFAEMQRLVARDTDFRILYDASAALARGLDPYAATENAYRYPPTFALLFRPLLWLPIAGASLLWFVIKLALLIWTLKACWELLEGGDLPARRRHLFLLGLVYVAARFWIADLRYGNTNVLILYLGIGAVYWDGKDRREAAGLLEALAISCKVVPALLLGYFLARRRWRTLGWTALCLLLLNGSSWLLLGDAGAEAWRTYFGFGVVEQLASRLAQPDNQSLWGALGRALPDLSLSGVRLIWGALAALLTAVALLAARRSAGRGPRDRVLAASLFFLLGLLVSPGSWVVHYTAVLLPLGVLWRWLLAEGSRSAAFWSLFVAVNLVFSSSGWSRWSVRISIEESLFVLAALALFAGLSRLALRRPRAAAGP
jgi:alpha-1,2-mannosyltransferase